MDGYRNGDVEHEKAAIVTTHHSCACSPVVNSEIRFLQYANSHACQYGYSSQHWQDRTQGVRARRIQRHFGSAYVEQLVQNSMMYEACCVWRLRLVIQERL
jgi:hypothetical protein